MVVSTTTGKRFDRTLLYTEWLLGQSRTAFNWTIYAETEYAATLTTWNPSPAR